MKWCGNVTVAVRKAASIKKGEGLALPDSTLRRDTIYSESGCV